jgi:hypothetical protein
VEQAAFLSTLEVERGEGRGQRDGGGIGDVASASNLSCMELQSRVFAAYLSHFEKKIKIKNKCSLMR